MYTADLSDLSTGIYVYCIGNANEMKQGKLVIE
jgi:hypothetical protein